MTSDLQEQMRRQMADQALFRQAFEHGLSYLSGVDDRPVYPTDEAVASLESFAMPLPEGPCEPGRVLDSLNAIGAPATTAQIGGRFFGFVNGGAVPIGLAARLMADCWDQNAALTAMSPIAGKLEEVAEDWLRDLFDLPQGTVAGFVSGTSLAIVAGLAAGRWRIAERAGWDINAKGFAGAPPIRIITSRHTHSAVTKAIGLLGFGTDSIEWVEVDAQGRMRADLIPDLDASCLVVAQAGNVNSGAFDPLEEICDRANAAGAWVHVDGAFGLWAQAAKGLRHLTKGMEKAQSFSVDAHKTLNAPYDSGIVLSTDAQALASALQASGSYLLFDGARDGMTTTPEMSRRARGIELWAILAALGRSGIDALIQGLHDRAVQMADELEDAGFEVLNDVVFNQVMVAQETDEVTEALLKELQSDGTCWVGGATWFGRKIIRISICSWATTPEDVSRTVAAFARCQSALAHGPAARRGVGGGGRRGCEPARSDLAKT
ncbi:MAG: aminotransferase class V-fold PLP-dependent enzyme [Pseudomonadota bacterium]